MSRRTKFVQEPILAGLTEIYLIFMVPKPARDRLFPRINPMNADYQSAQPPPSAAVLGTNAFEPHKESQLKLSLETRNCSDVIVVHCQGRIVYRDEAAALARVVGEVLQQTSSVVLDLSGVSSMDSAGIGELALLQTWAQQKNASLKVAGANALVRTLLDLTNLDSVIEVHPTLAEALESFREERVGADC
jgi:anti-sigma B factor antagonist